MMSNPPDPRKLAVRTQGTPLRDAAVDPKPGDYLAPINAGKPGEEGNPHGSNVVSPELRMLPGMVHGDPKAQQEPIRKAEAKARADHEKVTRAEAKARAKKAKDAIHDGK